MADVLYTSFGVNHSALLRENARSGYQRFWAFTVDPAAFQSRSRNTPFAGFTGTGAPWMTLRN